MGKDWRASHDGVASAGEPLFDFGEIARKVRLSEGQLRGLSRKYPGLQAWRSRHNSTSRARTLYRMSDFWRWWQALPDGVRAGASK